MKNYSVFIHISCNSGVFNDVYNVSAESPLKAKTAAVRRVIDEMDDVTEISVIAVSEA